ncbi:uncharacterized protein PRCAT00001535001 [Priceomyces carsonii]|uniref:uncharacterized protein n=1 Tax=Priceomyces carsonii TaxID=28549 RepID=UPI002EDADFC9|nr:unnamed protein product [Priceomyces carsonii]
MQAEEVEGSPETELSIKEEYQLWRKNCRYMYEFVSETALTWPSLTIEWLPNYTEEEGVLDCKLLLGTHTSGEDTNFLKIASTSLPSGTQNNDKKVTSRIKITRKFENNYEINRARYLPQDPSILGTINGHGEIDIYSLKEQEKLNLMHFRPHEDNGYGLSWNRYKKGYLLTASDDHTIVLTDVSDKPAQVFQNKSHGDIVNDAKWHSTDQNLFGSVSDDKYFYLFDIREPSRPSLKFYSKDSNGINSLAFSPFSGNLAVLGNANSNVSLIDIRQLSSNDNSSDGYLHTMMGHSDSITCLEFSPHKDGIIASGSQDRRLILWDITRIGEEQIQEDAEDGCPELFMMHAGHTGAVMDLNWCPFKEWTLGSVADDNIVHLWLVGEKIINSDEVLNVDLNSLE